MSAEYKLTGATVRIGGRVIPLQARSDVSEVAPGERLPLGKPWSFGPIPLTVDPETAAKLVELAQELTVEVELHSVFEGPHCVRGLPKFHGTVQDWVEWRKLFETKFVHGEQGASCNE